MKETFASRAASPLDAAGAPERPRNGSDGRSALRPSGESTAFPTLDALRETTTYTAMVHWLASCPMALFVTHGHEIRAVFEERRFQAAVDLCDITTAILHQVREPDERLLFIGQTLDRALKDLPGLRAWWRADEGEGA